MAKNRTGMYKEELANVTNNDQVRELILRAAQEKGGVSKSLNELFKDAYTKTQGVFQNAQGKFYKVKNAMDYAEFTKLVGTILGLQTRDIKLEIRMRYHWLIVSGDTREVKDTLNAIGFWWDKKNKSGWGFNFKKAPNYDGIAV